MRILLNGACGRMGRMLLDRVRESAGIPSAPEITARVDPCLPDEPAAGAWQRLEDCTAEADVVIDFSHHSTAPALAGYCRRRALPLVVATTGHSAEELEALERAAEEIAVFRAPNMSLGVAVLADLAKKAASAFPGADIEIVETHHNQKLDVPSGTALLLAEALREGREPEPALVIGRHQNGRRSPGEIGIHSLRLGSEVGTHEILISTGTETLTLTHRAHSRAVFADGALAAAAFLLGREKGMYTMQDMLKD